MYHFSFQFSLNKLNIIKLVQQVLCNVSVLFAVNLKSKITQYAGTAEVIPWRTGAC